MASILVDRRTYDFANIQLAIADGKTPLGGPFEQFDELSYSDNVDREKLYGASRVPIDHTDGIYDAEGAITLHRNLFDALIDYALSVNKGYYELEFTLTANYRKKPDDPVRTDTITQVKFASRENAHSQGPENLVVPCDLFIGGLIYHNGLGPLNERL